VSVVSRLLCRSRPYSLPQTPKVGHNLQQAATTSYLLGGRRFGLTLLPPPPSPPTFHLPSPRAPSPPSPPPKSRPPVVEKITLTPRPANPQPDPCPRHPPDLTPRLSRLHSGGRATTQHPGRLTHRAAEHHPCTAEDLPRAAGDPARNHWTPSTVRSRMA